MKSIHLPLLALALLLGLPAHSQAGPLPEMHWADVSSGRPYSKDPSVIRFGDGYLMYCSLPGAEKGIAGWSVGIARSKDLIHWASFIGKRREP